MPALELTEDVKRDLRLIQLRSVLDPKHFYKKDSSLLGLTANDGRPKFVQVGTMVDGTAMDFQDRVSKRQRNKRIVDELLEDSEKRAYFKKKTIEQLHRKQANMDKQRYVRKKKMKK